LSPETLLITYGLDRYYRSLATTTDISRMSGFVDTASSLRSAAIDRFSPMHFFKAITVSGKLPFAEKIPKSGLSAVCEFERPSTMQ